MPDSVTLRIDKRRLLELAGKLGQRADDIVGRMAFQAQGDAQVSMGVSPSSPGDPPGVDTGALRASVHTERVSNAVWMVSDGVDYGAYLEFGTPRMAARPWLRPAVLRLRDSWAKYFKDLFE